MGSLILPTSDPIYLEANGFIYSVAPIAPYRTMLEPMGLQAQAGQFKIVSSERVILETLVKPFRAGDALLESVFRTLISAREVQLIPATAALWKRAARLRATTSLRTPDALHAVTSFAVGSTLFITNDEGFRRVPGLPLVLLKDLVEEGEAQEEAP